MRKQLNLIKKLMIVVALLAVFQVILLSIAPDTKHIILTSIVIILLVSITTAIATKIFKKKESRKTNV